MAEAKDSYEFLGDGEQRGDRTHYKSLRVRRGATEQSVYEVGDVVCVNGTTGYWVAHVVSFFYDRDDGDIGAANVRAEELCKADLRWFYRFHELDGSCRRRCAAPLPQELYISDRIESNYVASILWHARVVASEKSLANIATKNRSETKNAAYICRYLYGNANSSSTVPAIRRLNNGELDALLRNPTSEELYRGIAGRRLHLGPVAKGVNSKRYSPTSGISTKDPIRPMHSAASEKIIAVPGKDGDSTAQFADTSSVTTASSRGADGEEIEPELIMPTQVGTPPIGTETTTSKYNLRSKGAGSSRKQRYALAAPKTNLAVDAPQAEIATGNTPSESAVDGDIGKKIEWTDGNGATERATNSIHPKYNLRRNVTGPCGSRRKKRMEAVRESTQARPVTRIPAVSHSPHHDASSSRSARKGCPVKLCDLATHRLPVAINRMNCINRRNRTPRVAAQKKFVPKTARKTAHAAVSYSMDINPPQEEDPLKAPPGDGAVEETNRLHSNKFYRKTKAIARKSARGNPRRSYQVDGVPEEDIGMIDVGNSAPSPKEYGGASRELNDVPRQSCVTKMKRIRSSHGDQVCDDERIGQVGESPASSKITEEEEEYGEYGEYGAFRELAEVWAGMSDTEQLYHSLHLKDIVAAMFDALDKSGMKEGEEWCDEMADESIRLFNQLSIGER